VTQTTRRSFTQLALALPALSALPLRAEAAEEAVRIGATYPFTGVAASAGTALRQAVELAVDIVNNPHPELDALPLGPGRRPLQSRRS
jgi:branched-chain amino acid transport system substrate-binding protein